MCIHVWENKNYLPIHRLTCDNSLFREQTRYTLVDLEKEKSCLVVDLVMICVSDSFWLYQKIEKIEASEDVTVLKWTATDQVIFSRLIKICHLLHFHMCRYYSRVKGRQFRNATSTKQMVSMTFCSHARKIFQKVWAWYYTPYRQKKKLNVIIYYHTKSQMKHGKVV